MNDETQGIDVKDIAIGIIVAIILALFIRIMIGEIMFIPSGSMEPELLIGDNILVSKIAYSFGPSGDMLNMHMPEHMRIWFSKPQKRDIIVFRPPSSAIPEGAKTLFVKRIIAGPRDEHPVTGDVIPAKGMVIASNSILASMLKMINDPGTNQGDEYVVGEDYYYVLGDNRNHSFDSEDWGLIPSSSIIGKAVLVIWSQEIDSIGKKNSLRTSRLFQFCK